MAKKNDMIKDIIQFYRTFTHLFIRFQLTEKRFFNWFDAFQSYPDIYKVHKFIFTGPSSLFALTIPAEAVWTRLSPLQWQQLPSISAKHPQLVELQKTITQIRKAWGTRPHAISKTERENRAKRSKSAHQTYGAQGLES